MQFPFSRYGTTVKTNETHCVHASLQEFIGIVYMHLVCKPNKDFLDNSQAEAFVHGFVDQLLPCFPTFSRKTLRLLFFFIVVVLGCFFFGGGSRQQLKNG